MKNLDRIIDSQEAPFSRKNAGSINACDIDGRTQLVNATIEGNVDLVRTLISKGADVNLVDSNGWSALHFAAQGFDHQIASLLLEHSAQVDAQDVEGNTPLSNAVFNSKGQGDLIELLLSHGADMNLKNKHGVSPLDLAKSIGNYDVAQFFV